MLWYIQLNPQMMICDEDEDSVWWHEESNWVTSAISPPSQNHLMLSPMQRWWRWQRWQWPYLKTTWCCLLMQRWWQWQRWQWQRWQWPCLKTTWCCLLMQQWWQWQNHLKLSLDATMMTMMITKGMMTARAALVITTTIMLPMVMTVIVLMMTMTMMMTMVKTFAMVMTGMMTVMKWQGWCFRKWKQARQWMRKVRAMLLALFCFYSWSLNETWKLCMFNRASCSCLIVLQWIRNVRALLQALLVFTIILPLCINHAETMVCLRWLQCIGGGGGGGGDDGSDGT